MKGAAAAVVSVSDRYKRCDAAGAGAFGEVYMATHIETGEGVAVKRLRPSESEQRDKKLAQREVYIMRALQGCEHVVRLLDVMTNRTQDMTFLVMERMQHDLRGLLSCKDISSRWPRSHIKNYAQQLLTALAFCHGRGYMHRDLKPENLLLDKCNTLKLADFGLSSKVLPAPLPADFGGYTNPMATRWYRPLEIYYGARDYGTAIDVWAAGCIIGELLQNSVLLPGTSDDEQPGCIHALCGTPLENGWPAAAQLPRWRPPVAVVRRDLFSTLITHNKLVARKGYFSHVAVSLLDAMLALDPSTRISAEAALSHAYFSDTEDGIPCAARHEMIRHNERSYFGRRAAAAENKKK